MKDTKYWYLCTGPEPHENSFPYPRSTSARCNCHKCPGLLKPTSQNAKKYAEKEKESA